MMDTQVLTKIVAFLCSVPPESHLRLALQLALAADIPDSKRQELFAQLQSERTLPEMLLEDNLLTHILAADGKIGDAEENMLLEAMDKIGLVVPNSMKGAELLLEDLSSNLADEVSEIKTTGSLQESSLVW